MPCATASRCTGCSSSSAFRCWAASCTSWSSTSPPRACSALRARWRTRPSASSTPSASTARPPRPTTSLPTAQNKLRLARAALDRGQAADAVGHYRDALKGPLASDPELQFGLASALLAAGGATAGRDALQALHTLRSTRDDYRKDEVAVLTARALAADNQQAEARQAFEDALGRYNTVEARARYIAWLAQQGDTAGAQRQWDELQQAARHWNSHARSVNREWMRLAGDAVRG